MRRKVGAKHTVNSATSDLHTELQQLTDGQGPHVLIEAVGIPQTFRAAVDEACFAGRVVYIGYAKKPVEYDTRYIVQRELDIMGSRNALPADFKAVIAYLERGTFPVDEVVTQVGAARRGRPGARRLERESRRRLQDSRRNRLTRAPGRSSSA